MSSGKHEVELTRRQWVQSALLAAGSGGLVSQLPAGKLITLLLVRDAEGGKPVLWGVFIGVEKLQNHPGREAKYARNDAKEMCRCFEELAVQDERRSWLDTCYNPTREQFLQAVSKIKEAPAGSTAILFVSSHGVVCGDPLEAFLVPSDAPALPGLGAGADFASRAHANVKQLRQTLVPLDELVLALLESEAACRLLIVDACHAGNVNLQAALQATRREIIEGKWLRGRGRKDKWRLGEFYALLSCEGKEKSYWDDKYELGVFTYWLSLGMKGSADGMVKEPDGNVTADELIEFARAHVPAATKNKDWNGDSKPDPQHPTIVMFSEQLPQKRTVLRLKPAEKPEELVKLLTEQLEALLESTLDPAKRADTRIALPPFLAAKDLHGLFVSPNLISYRPFDIWLTMELYKRLWNLGYQVLDPEVVSKAIVVSGRAEPEAIRRVRKQTGADLLLDGYIALREDNGRSNPLVRVVTIAKATETLLEKFRAHCTLLVPSAGHPGAPAPHVPPAQDEQRIWLEEVADQALFGRRNYSVRLWWNEQRRRFYRVRWPGDEASEPVYVAPGRDGVDFGLEIASRMVPRKTHDGHTDPKSVLCVFVMLDGRHIFKRPLASGQRTRPGETEFYWVTEDPKECPFYWVFPPSSSERLRYWYTYRDSAGVETRWETERLRFGKVPRSMKGPDRHDAGGHIRIAFYYGYDRKSRSEKEKQEFDVFVGGEKGESTIEVPEDHPARWVTPGALCGVFQFYVVAEDAIKAHLRAN